MQLGEGHRQNSAVARNERFSLASGRQVRQDQWWIVTDRSSEPLPPSVGALVFLGFLSSGSTSKKIHAIPCRKNCRHSSVSGRTELAEARTDLWAGYQRTRSVNPARHAHPSRHLRCFFRDGLRVAPRRLRRLPAAGV